MKLDIEFVRSQYPVFQNPETARWAFFENAGGSYVPRQVTDRLDHFFRFTKVQPYGEAFNRGIRANQVIVEADREAVESPGQLERIVDRHKAGESLLLRIQTADAVAFVAVQIPE